MISDPANNNMMRDFISELRRPEAPATLRERARLQQVGAGLINSLKDHDGSKFNELLVEPALESVPFTVGFKKSFLGSFLYYATGVESFLDLAMQGIREQAINIPNAMSDLFALQHLRFVSGHNNWDSEFDQKTFACLWTHFNRIVERLQNNRSAIGLAPQGAHISERRAVVITEQLLAPGHAPTRYALEAARSLMLNHDMQVLLVNTAQYPSVPVGSILSPLAPSYIKKYSQTSALEYENHIVNVFQPLTDGLGEAALISLVERIEAFYPSLVLVVGDACPVGELFNDRAIVMQCPLSIDPPITKCNNFSLYLPPDDRVNSMLHKMSTSDNFLFVAAGIYPTLPSLSTKTREGLSLPEEDFVYAVVGNRLAAECDQQFFDCLDTICRAGGIHIFFIGPYDVLDSITSQYHHLREHYTHSEYEQDLMAAFHQCDGYINPMRKGGGTSAVHAMQAGLPVLTLPKGDVVIAGSKFPQISSFDELAAVAIELHRNRKLHDKYRQLAIDGAEELTQFDEVIAKFVQEYERLVV